MSSLDNCISNTQICANFSFFVVYEDTDVLPLDKIYFHLSLLTNAAIKFLITEYYPHLIAGEFPKKRDGARFTQDLTSLRIYSANLFVQLAEGPSIEFSKSEEN